MVKIFICFLLLCLFSFPASGKGPADELRRLREQLQQQQREIDRLSAIAAQRENELRKIKVWMANLSADGKLTTVSDREQRLLFSLKTLGDASGDMVLKTMEMAELLRRKLDSLPLASADRIRLVMALEELERSAARVNAIADAGVGSRDKLLRDVRVTEIKYELNMAVLSVGALQGVFPGMTFTASDGKVRLRVVETRAMISGAIPVSGSLNSLTPGARVKFEIMRAAVR